MYTNLEMWVANHTFWHRSHFISYFYCANVLDNLKLKIIYTLYSNISYFFLLKIEMSLSNRDKMSIGFHSFPPQCIIQIWFRSVQCSHRCNSKIKVWYPTKVCRALPWLICPIIVVVPPWAGSEWLCFSSVSSSPSLACRWRSVPQTCASSCCATLLKRRCCTCSPRCVQLDDSPDRSPSARWGKTGNVNMRRISNLDSCLQHSVTVNVKNILVFWFSLMASPWAFGAGKHPNFLMFYRPNNRLIKKKTC